MTKRKYAYYIIVREDEDADVFYQYGKAFQEYSKCKTSATLYGVDENEQVFTIFSK